jgi:hypothetical protein
MSSKREVEIKVVGGLNNIVKQLETIVSSMKEGMVARSVFYISKI